MSGHKLAKQMGDAAISWPVPGNAFNIPGYGYLMRWGLTVPSDGAAGYAKGCIFFHLDGASQALLTYVNVGTKTSCNFDSIGIATDLGAAGLLADAIVESTLNAGVTIEGMLLKDSILKTDNVIEKTAATGVTLDGTTLIDGTVVAPSAAATIAAALTPVFSGGMAGCLINVFEKQSATLNAISTTLLSVPANHVILAVNTNIDAALTGGSTTAKVGIGVAASDPDLYGLSADLNKNTKTNVSPTFAMLAAQADLSINACATGGALGDTALTVGKVRVRVVTLSFPALPNT